MLTRLLACFALVFSIGNVQAQFPLVAPTDAKTPEEERKSFKLPPGFEAQLVASDPDILKPMQLAFDLKGRMFVTMSQEYPWAAFGRKPKDRLMVLSDFGADGKAKKVETFADELNIPIGLLPLPDCKTVLVSSIDPGPDSATAPIGCFIWELTDTDGDGKADKRRKLFGPFGIRDTHGMVNSFTLMPDGWVYACHGFSNDSKVKGTDGHEVTMHSGNTFRFRPDGSRIEVFTRGQVNPFGLTHDPWFNFYTADCHSKPMTQLIRGAVYQSFGKPHDGLGYGPEMIRHDHGSTGLCGLAWYQADQFPKDYLGGMFLGNVVNSRINWDKIKFNGSTPEAVQQSDFMTSTDLWFRPVDIKLGPDGALYVSDFYNKLIGHYEVPLLHPGRDRTRGRIWRIVYNPKHETIKPPGDLTKLKHEDLDKLLGSSNLALRMQATIALINPLENRKAQEEARKVEEMEANVYETHKMWVDEAEPIRKAREQKKQMAKAMHREDSLRAVHEIRLRTAQAEWEADELRRGDRVMRDRLQDQFKIGGNEQLARAAAEWMTAVPKAENVLPLVKGIASTPKVDDHLRHARRIALRETLRDPASWTALKAMQLDDQAIGIIADVAKGLPRMDAADFLTANLKALADDSARLPEYVEHASRHGDGMKTLYTFITTHKPDNVRLTVALFHAYARGLQQKGGTRFDKDDTEFAEKLVGRGLADSDGATIQRCFEMTTSLKLKNSLETVVGFAARKDRNENQRAAALLTVSALDAARGVKEAAKILANPEEPIAMREKTAQGLGSLGTPAAHSELLAVIEKAPARLQTVVAAALAAKPEGAELLLKAVAAGKASGRLLQERVVSTKVVESKLPKAAERMAELTKGLPNADAKMTELMANRRDAFTKAKPDAKLGAVIFKNNCANCHQLANEGAKIGPQLDGIGVRGLDRMLEDMLDPSRNVDQAFRTTVLNLKDNRTVSGLFLKEEGQLLVLADSLGKEVRIPKNDVDERRISLLSPMPANLVETIKEEDFYHLLAFLLQQRIKEK